MTQTYKPFGATCEAVIAQLELSSRIQPELWRELEALHHTEWFWSLLDVVELEYNDVYVLVVAMHIDAGVKFDKETCTITPYSPWGFD